MVLFKNFKAKLIRYLTKATIKQKEVYVRYMHTLSAASVVGAITVAFTGSKTGFESLFQVIGLGICAVILFVAGLFLTEGE